jgi:hypothetical protein
LVPTSGEPDAGVFGAANLAAAVNRELVDRCRNGLAGDGEHGRPHRMAVNHAADVVERVIAGQVQLHLTRRRTTVLGSHDGAIRVDQHEIVKRHVRVVDRRRCDDEVAVLAAGRDVARGSLDQAAPRPR